ncbi:hypothetical protein NQ314_006756 [Rhamnusium bicolor]|uniref:Uncharacterized protein n=1 Tax=Rhamnusium bicolor TaxID=1586634 RepID=A0AAV8YZM4_9CUCU|nr:hypothetical protein NQ314_006756 [Rhamnusium bicolor]
MASPPTLSKLKTPRSFEEAISLVGFGKFNLFVLLATGLCLMCVIIETMCAMFIIPAAQCDLNLNLTEKGLLYSISFFGVVSSSHLWGFIADTKGRKKVLLISLVSSAVVSFICSVVSMPWLFIFLRFINGFLPWRLLIIIYALPSLISAILIFFLPESPKYLLTQGKKDEVMHILTKIFRINTGKSGDEYTVSSILWDDSILEVKHEENENMFKSMWNQTVPLFKRTFLIKTILVCFLQFAIFLSKDFLEHLIKSKNEKSNGQTIFRTSSVVMWYPQILNSMTDYGKVVAQNEVTMCKSILYDEDEHNKRLSRSLVVGIF